MTLEELSVCVDLLEMMRRNNECIQTLRGKSLIGAQKLTGMPRGSGTSDPVYDYVREIDTLEQANRALQEQIDRLSGPIEEYISKIEDGWTRVIFRLRFLQGQSWKEVADTIGGRITESGVKSMCYRQIEKVASQ